MKKKQVDDLLQEYGISAKQLERVLNRNRMKSSSKKSVEREEGDRFSFAVVSDTHFCSTEAKEEELKIFYEEVKKRKITTVLNAGDLIAGMFMYTGQEFEIHTFGAKNQAEYLIKNYPRVKGVTTYFINGNHDLSFYKKAGIDVGELISEKRDDMIYLGQYQGDVELSGVKIRLLHPDSGNAYAISYKIQKIVEQIPSSRKPHILICGHYHTALYFFYRNIHCFNAGCFEGQSTFLMRKGINPVIGGWIIDVEVSGDSKKTLLSVAPTFIPFIEKE